LTHRTLIGFGGILFIPVKINSFFYLQNKFATFYLPMNMVIIFLIISQPAEE